MLCKRNAETPATYLLCWNYVLYFCIFYYLFWSESSKSGDFCAQSLILLSFCGVSLLERSVDHGELPLLYPTEVESVKHFHNVQKISLIDQNVSFADSVTL